MRTATRSTRSPFLPTARRSSPVQTTRRSKFGIQVLAFLESTPRRPCAHNIFPPTAVSRCPPFAATLELVEERKGDGSALDASGSGAVAERDGATLRLKEGGGVFYAPGPLQSVAVHWPRLVAGAQSGALYHLEVQG